MDTSRPQPPLHPQHPCTQGCTILLREGGSLLRFPSICHHPRCLRAGASCQGCSGGVGASLGEGISRCPVLGHLLLGRKPAGGRDVGFGGGRGFGVRTPGVCPAGETSGKTAEGEGTVRFEVTENRAIKFHQ